MWRGACECACCPSFCGTCTCLFECMRTVYAQTPESRVYVCVRMYTHVCMCLCVCVYVRTHNLVCVCTYTHTTSSRHSVNLTLKCRYFWWQEGLEDGKRQGTGTKKRAQKNRQSISRMEVGTSLASHMAYSSSACI